MSQIAPLPPDADDYSSSRGPFFAPPPPSFNERFPFPTWLEVLLMPFAEIVLAFFIAVPILLISVVAQIASGGALSMDQMFTFTSWLAVVPVIVWGWWRSRLPFTEAIGLRKTSLTIMLAVIPLSLGFHILSSELDNVQYTFVNLPNYFEAEFSSLFESPIAGFIVLAIVAPMTEEPVFRGLILGGLLRRRRVVTSVLASAFMFSLIHLNPAQMPLAFLFGLFAAWLFLRTRSLWPCLLSHAILNGSGHVVTYVANMEIQGYNTEPARWVFQPWWFDMAGALLLAVGLLAFCGATAKRRRLKAPEGMNAVNMRRSVEGDVEAPDSRGDPQ